MITGKLMTRKQPRPLQGFRHSPFFLVIALTLAISISSSGCTQTPMNTAKPTESSQDASDTCHMHRTWELVQVNTQTLVNSPETGNRFTLDLTDKHRASGVLCCNQWSGQYQLQPDSKHGTLGLYISQPITTRMLCHPDNALMAKLENEFFTELNGAKVQQVGKQQLQLRVKSGDLWLFKANSRE